MNKNIIVVGSGSIAKRHMRNLKTLFPEATIGCVSASGRTVQKDEVDDEIYLYADLTAAVASKPYFAVIASPAPFHLQQALEFLRNGVPTFIEKPLSDSYAQYLSVAGLLDSHRQSLDVGYNLRFLPAAVKLKAMIDTGALGNIYSVHANVGQYLPSWRPNTPYHLNVSAKKSLGGGVLLELSHELDYLKWLFGNFKSVYCTSRNTGALEIDVEDTIDAILITAGGLAVNLHMDFLQRSPVRQCTIVADKGSLVWNIINNNIAMHYGKDNVDIIFSDHEYDRNKMYTDELVAFEQVVSGSRSPCVGLESAADTLRLIDALKLSSEINQVINLEAGSSL